MITIPIDDEKNLTIEKSDGNYNALSTGQRIRQYRKELGLSQKTLAEKIGVTQSSIALWEKDKTTPGYNNIRALADVFDTTAFSLCDSKTWDTIKTKLPRSESPTIETAEADEYFTHLTNTLAENIFVTEEHEDLINEHLKLLEDHQKLLQRTATIAPIMPLYSQLNEKGKGLVFGLLSHMVQNPKYTSQDSSDIPLEKE